MRLALAIVPLLTIAGCNTPSTVPAPSATSGVESIPFEQPLNPAALKCSDVLSNNAAADFASAWIAGHRRARILQGVDASPVDETAIAQSLISYCSVQSDPNRTIADALVDLT